jgi:hypothetical protein
MTVRHKALLCSLLVVTGLVVAVARPAPAAAATPCWKALLNDWYDGRIDNTYPLHCYQDALGHLPADVQTYSSARDDILRALQNAKAQLRKAGRTAAPNTLIVPPSSNGKPGTGGTKTGTGKHPGRKTRTTPIATTPIATTPTPGRDSGKGLTHLADRLNPSSPSSLPLPLLVLGALAVMLVAAGGAGLLAKRYQGRKPAP